MQIMLDIESESTSNAGAFESEIWWISRELLHLRQSIGYGFDLELKNMVSRPY